MIKNIDFFGICDGILLFIDDDDSNKSFDTANKIGICGRKVIPNSYEDIIKLLNEYEITSI